jgi:hypothetical protein
MRWAVETPAYVHRYARGYARTGLVRPLLVHDTTHRSPCATTTRAAKLPRFASPPTPRRERERERERERDERMFDTMHDLPGDLQPAQRLRPRQWPGSAAHRPDLETRGTDGQGCPPDSTLHRLGQSVNEALPWVNRDSCEPVGMWVEAVGRVDNDFEPFQRGTPYAWIGVASWEAAQAVYATFASIARIDDGRWIGGWFRSTHGFRKIKIYPRMDGEIGANADSKWPMRARPT